MSDNDMAVIDKREQLPAHLQKANVLAAAFNSGVREGISQGFSRISIRGSRWRILKGGEETVLDSLTLEAVIIGANPTVSKLYYAKAYNPDDSDMAPDCFSNNGKSPDPSSSSPQCESCAACPQNVWGSKISENGNEVKACSDLKRIAVLAAGDLGGTIFAFTIPAASLKGLANYIDKLDKRGVSALAVKTQLSFDPEMAFPKVDFKVLSFVTEEELDTIMEQAESDDVKLVTGQSGVINHGVPVAEAAKEAVEAEPEKVAKPAAAKKVTKKKTTKKSAKAVAAERDDSDDGGDDAKAATASAFGSGTAVDPTAAVAEPAEPEGTDSQISDDLDDVLGDLDFNED